MWTLSEKIISRHCGHKVEVGEIVEVTVDVCMSHENTFLVMKRFRDIAEKVYNTNKIVIVFDHRVPPESESTAMIHQRIREFVFQQKIKHFYDMNAGICHQVLSEKGHVLPGSVIVGTDSHTLTQGAFGAFSIGVGATDMAVIWATGKIWLKVPETIKIIVTGKFRKYVSAKDLILNIIGTLKNTSYKSIEFYGETIENMSISSRMTLCNMCAELDAKTAIIPPDKKTVKYIKSRTSAQINDIQIDAKAQYAETLEIDVSEMDMQVACPHSVSNVRSVYEVAGTPIHQAFVGSCTNGRLEDLKAIANILKNRKISKYVRMIVVPASYEIYLKAVKLGYISTLLQAGAIITNPGCGPCIGVHQGVLSSGETCMSTGNRNFRGRMGSPESKIYLASPSVVAVSALKGSISYPE